MPTKDVRVIGLHESVLDSLPGGLIVTDLDGSVLVFNRSAERILAVESRAIRQSHVREVFRAQPEIADIILKTCKTLDEKNRQEVRVFNGRGQRILLGYGTLVFRGEEGHPVGVGLTFQDITRFVPMPANVQFISLINRFFMPFTVAMVVAAMIWGLAETYEKYIATVILAGLVAFNYFVGWQAQQPGHSDHGIKRFHTPVNFLGLGSLVYLLGTLWGPMWLLFVLTPLAASLYTDRLATAAIAVLSAVFLLGIYEHRGLTGTIGWAQAFLHALFIVFVSMFANALANLVSRVRSGR
ncbi:MAG: PAS domain-containing protein [Elusimicrobia bacterium]|nr:PAS domain-containing protein [Elusimicrobiota bacterium]